MVNGVSGFFGPLASAGGAARARQDAARAAGSRTFLMSTSWTGTRGRGHSKDAQSTRGTSHDGARPLFRGGADPARIPFMCRNIRPLFNFEPPATEAEVKNAALQFVRKISSTQKPSKANAAAFE